MDRNARLRKRVSLDSQSWAGLIARSKRELEYKRFAQRGFWRNYCSHFLYLSGGYELPFCAPYTVDSDRDLQLTGRTKRVHGRNQFESLSWQPITPQE